MWRWSLCDPAGGEASAAERLGRLCLALVAAAWLGNAGYAVGEPGGGLETAAAVLVALSMIGYVLLHGFLTLGLRRLLLFLATVVVIAWSVEALALHTGFPFGHYRYGARMAPFVGGIPLLVVLVYGVMGYVAWSLAGLLLHGSGVAAGGRLPIGRPLLAAALMVVWDISMDPLRSTIEGRWIWVDDGAHYGVPLSNFLGWFALTWLMFQAYALFDGRGPARAPIPTGPVAIGFRRSVPLMYLAFAVEYLLNPLVVEPAGIAAGLSISVDAVAAIYQGVAVLAATTMVPIATVALFLIGRGEAGGRDRRPMKGVKRASHAAESR